MSENEKNLEPELPAFVKKAPELIPVWDWWVKEGRSTVLTLAIAGLAVAAFFGWRHWKKSESAKANAALVAMLSPEANIESQEEAVASYGSSKSGPMMRAVLAKAYYDDGRFEDALAAYEQLAKDADNASALADIARLGSVFVILDFTGKKEDADAAKDTP